MLPHAGYVGDHNPYCHNDVTPLMCCCWYPCVDLHGGFDIEFGLIFDGMIASVSTTWLGTILIWSNVTQSCCTCMSLNWSSLCYYYLDRCRYFVVQLEIFDVLFCFFFCHWIVVSNCKYPDIVSVFLWYLFLENRSIWTCLYVQSIMVPIFFDC